MWYGTGATWTQTGDSYTQSEAGAACTSGNGLACWQQAANISTYSQFGLGSGATPTAVDLSSLSAVGNSNQIIFTLVLGSLGFLLLGAVVLRKRRKDIA